MKKETFNWRICTAINWFIVYTCQWSAEIYYFEMKLPIAAPMIAEGSPRMAETMILMAPPAI